MLYPLSRISILTIILGLGSSLALAEPAANGQPDSPNTADQHVWTLTDYLKGTPPQIRDQVNGELERLTAKQKDLRQRKAWFDSAILAEQAAAINAVRKSDAYLKLAAEKTQAEADLNTARAGGTAQEKLDASSNFNRLRTAMEKMEADAVANDAKIPQLLKDKQEILKASKQCDDAVITARKWRDKLISAVREGSMLAWPLDVGAMGILGIVTPVRDPDPNGIYIEFDAFELTKHRGEQEGIKEVVGYNHKVHLHVTGIDTKGMSKGIPVALDRTFVVTRTPRRDQDETDYEVRPKKDDLDRLFELLIPLRDAPPPAH